MSSCGGGGGNDPAPPNPGAPIPTLAIALKKLQFSWSAMEGTDHYRILVNPDGMSGFTVHPDAASITGTSHMLAIDAGAAYIF